MGVDVRGGAGSCVSSSSADGHEWHICHYLHSDVGVAKRLDLVEFANLFTNGKTFEPCLIVPRVRHYEDSYHILKRECSNLNMTWNTLHSLMHIKTVTAIYHGNRWLVNIDEVVKCAR